MVVVGILSYSTNTATGDGGAEGEAEGWPKGGGGERGQANLHSSYAANKTNSRRWLVCEISKVYMLMHFDYNKKNLQGFFLLNNGRKLFNY